MKRSVAAGAHQRGPVESPPEPEPEQRRARPEPDRSGVQQRRRRRLTGLGVLALLLAFGAVLSIAIGAKTIPVAEVWRALTGGAGVSAENVLIVRELRVPRTLLGALVGACLGLAGALMQGHTRNSIADPGILGITHGAAVGVVLATYVFGISSLLGSVWFAFAGALLGSVAVFIIGTLGGRGAPSPVTLALAGMAISYLLQGITSGLVLTDQESLNAYRFWKVGSIAIDNPEVALQVLPLLLVGIVIALGNAPALNALSLGEDVARSLGHRIARARRLGILAIAVLVGGAVALCGPIGFVGLIVPHVARFFTGADYRWVLPFSALLGGAVVLLADVVGRVVARPAEVQVGVMLAMVGAPFFIALVRRRKLVRL
ncbi:FecCD family ABC transporter permease [Salinifilum ghardaiensis]